MKNILEVKSIIVVENPAFRAFVIANRRAVE